MARRKSISDIAAQVERIRLNTITQRGGGNPSNVSREDVSRFRRARNAGRRYIANIQRARGVSNEDAARQRYAGTREMNTAYFGEYERQPWYSEDRVSRNVYMGLNNG